MDRKEIDKIFELCLLLITIIAAAELQYASYVFSQIYPQEPALTAHQIAEQMRSNAVQVNIVFRYTTFPLLVLITTWIILMLIQSIKTNFGILQKFRRFMKEFCWGLFGNLLVLEIITFSTLSVSTELAPSMIWGQVARFLSVFLTFPATWYYRKADGGNQQNHSRFERLGFVWTSVLENLTTYIIAYFVVFLILAWSIITPTPYPY